MDINNPRSEAPGNILVQQLPILLITLTSKWHLPYSAEETYNHTSEKHEGEQPVDIYDSPYIGFAIYTCRIMASRRFVVQKHYYNVKSYKGLLTLI